MVTIAVNIRKSTLLTSLLTRLGMKELSQLGLAMMALALAACASPDVVSNDRRATANAGSQISVEAPIGLPEGKVLQLETRLRDQLSAKGASVVPRGSGPAVYRVQGFCSAAPENRNTQLACVWDILDQSGERAYRLVVEETASGGRSDPWAAVNGAVLDRVAQATADGIVAWLPKRGSFFSNAPAPAVSFGGRRFFVGRVSGAPGDGASALSNSMIVALKSEGETVVASAAGAYQVRAKVSVSRASRGSQSIAIDWQLYDPKGRSLGSVDQKNKIKAGALDRNWGQNATNAARAAARGLIQLLPRK